MMYPRDRYLTADIYFGGCLHEDWPDEFPDPDSAFEAFLEGADEQLLSSAAREFRQLADLPDPDQHEVLRELSPIFSARLFGWDEREWVNDLAERAEELHGLARAPAANLRGAVGRPRPSSAAPGDQSVA